jgi:hypothetical protein
MKRQWCRALCVVLRIERLPCEHWQSKQADSTAGQVKGEQCAFVWCSVDLAGEG